MNEEQLPVELQWENMEANIFLKMEKLQPVAPPDKDKKHRRMILLACLLLLGAVSTLFILNNESASENTTDFAASPAMAVERMGVEEVNETEPMPATPAEQSTAAKAESPQAYTPQHNQQQSRRAVKQGGKSSDAAATLEWQETQSTYPRKSTSAEVFENATGTNQEGSEDLANPTTDEHPIIGSPNSSSVAPVAPLVAPQAMAPLVSQSSNKDAAHLTTTLPAESSCPIFKARSPQVWLTGGVSQWRAGYGSAKPERAEFESAILSYQGQFSYVHPVKKSLFLLAGLRYQQLESRLDWNTQIADYAVTLEDTIIQIRRNAITGEETQVRGDITLTVIAERKVRHFNSFRLLQMPLGVGKTWESGKLQSHVFVGGVASLSFSRQGRTLYQAAVVDYDDSSAAIWTDKLTLSAMLGGGLSYRVTNRLGVMTMVQYEHSLSNWSAEQGITMQPRMLSWSLGIHYAL